MEQKELKAKYMEIICAEVWPQSPEMQEYARKECSYYIAELANGDIYAYDRPSIETNFCYGYGMYGITTDEEMDGASRMAEHARTHEDYFMEKNLEEILERIDRLKDAKSGRYEAYKYAQYSGQQHGTKLKTYSIVRLWDNPQNDPGRWSRMTDVERLTEDEIDALIQGWSVVKDMFIKRLNTYLKRYGLSKINTWTYLRD